VAVTKTTPAAVKVPYSTASDLHGGVGAITLRASSAYGSKTYESTGSYQVSVPNTADDIAITIASPTTAIERGACLTIAAGEAAAYECGALRIVHGIRGVRTMGKWRAPTLLYASETADPRPAIRADLLLKSSATTPDSLTGRLVIVNGTSQQQCDQRWTTSGWTPGTVRRVVAICTSTTLPTGAYPFTLEVTSVKSGAKTSFQESGTLIVVNRSSSAFGAGWSMAGLEQLFFPADANTRLWVSGDGSARVYRRVGSTNTFFADSLSRPDSLTYDPGTSTYTRWAAHRLQVRFNSAGLHTATTNRLGQTTTFSYTGGLLQSITVPPSGVGLAFSFGYTSGKLSSISSPGTPTTRVTRVYQSAGRVDSVMDADTSKVKFAYSATGKLITQRTDRLGHATTYAYDTTAGTLASVIRSMQSPASPIYTYFWAAEAMGVSGGAAMDTIEAYTVFLDPRFHFTFFWVDRFGAPKRATDPLGGVTVIEHADTRWPLLATKLTAPGDASTGHLTTTATYDGHGNISEQRVLAPLGVTGEDAVTTYAYDEKFDFPVRIQGPTGEVWRSVVDQATGNRLMESPSDTGGLRVTTYRYDSACSMVSAVIAPATPSDSIKYDSLCDPSGVKSPMGYWSTSASDAIGRVVSATAPDGKKDSTVYDVMGRVVKQLAIGPTRNGVASQTLTVSTHYDRSGRVTATIREASTSGSAGISPLVDSARYDWAGRKVAAIATDGAVDSTVYDPSGNVIKVDTRLAGAADSIIMAYDAVNRLVRRYVSPRVYLAESIGMGNHTGSLQWMHDYPMYPNNGGTGYTVAAQVDTFAYDAASRMIMANNGDAKVSRTYYPNGSIKTETQKVRTLADPTACVNYTDHVYTVAYEYDLAGRNTRITVPTQLAPRIQYDDLGAVLVNSADPTEVRDEITYTYDTGVNGTGWLERVDGLLPGDVFRYSYTRRGEVDSLQALDFVPDAEPARLIFDVKTYDDDGFLETHSVRGIKGNLMPLLRDETYVNDPVGRVLGASDRTSYEPQSVTPTEIAYIYSGLGHLISSGYETKSPDGFTDLTAIETMRYDAMGNWTTRNNTANSEFTARHGSGFQYSNGSRDARYEAVTGRLRGETLTGSRTDTLRYDEAGNVHAMFTVNAGSNPQQYNDRISYYGVDGKLVAADARSAVGGTLTGHTAFEEYRYDALGRRVLARVRRWCSDEPGAGNAGDEAACDVSAIKRTVWSGSSELAEIQMPATDSTPADTVENDTQPVKRARAAVVPQPSYDSNRLFGRVLYVHGLATDQPLAITRVNYADASDDSTGAVAWAVYAPFSIMPLWSSRGRADRSVMAGSAAPGSDLLCTDSTEARCVVVAIDRGAFPYARAGYDPGTWQGTLILDKPDATGTYYRRNRSYDPQTARFTQEDPIGLAGGVNLYGFAAGDPVSFSDPFGLCVDTDFNCENLVKMLRAQEGSEFQKAADVYESLKTGRVFFYSRLLYTTQKDLYNNDGDPTSYTLGNAPGDVFIRGDVSKADFLLTAVHESVHLTEGLSEDGPTNAELRAYRQLSPKERASAIFTAWSLRFHLGPKYGAPLPAGVTEPKGRQVYFIKSPLP
jgi:RHS repeat-associated protein